MSPKNALLTRSEPESPRRAMALPPERAAHESAPPVHAFRQVRILPRSPEGRSAGEAGDVAIVPQTGPTPAVTMEETGSSPVPQPVPTEVPPAATPVEGEGGGAVPAQTPQQQPPAAPTLTFAPATTLVRGTTLTATINFTPSAGSTLTVVGWSYTAGSDVVNRPAGDPNFNSSWSGVMAVSGTLDLTYRIDQGATQGAEQHLRQAITVNDRTGTPWESSITERAEAPFSGQPSPPRIFSQLGVHQVDGTTLPRVTASAIASGPNKDFTFAASLTAGSYISQPRIHPDLTNPASAFRRFHQAAGLLFLVPPTGARVRVSDPAVTFSITGGNTRDFSVPQWEAFYKRQRFITIRYAQGGNTYTVPDAEWSLDTNARDSNITISAAADPHIRAALHLSATDPLPAPAITQRGSWDPFPLLNGAAILSGTQSHEYRHADHSHRGNYRKMMRALDPQRKSESKVYSPGTAEDFANLIQTWWTEIANGMASHKLVDEARSRTAEAFVDNGTDMAGVNVDPSTGNILGVVWNISGDAEMTN